MYIFETIHGSRLYGLHHADSDNDYFRVLRFGATQRTKHKITGSDDTLTLTFQRFVQLAGEGRHQALEAMYSTIPSHDEIEHFRGSFRPSQSAVIDAYSRTIRSFAFSGTYKKRRHALRLSHNLNEFLDKGRFDPTLNQSVAANISTAAHTEGEAFIRLLHRRSVVSLFEDYYLTSELEGV
jgi:hypothetical protein